MIGMPGPMELIIILLIVLVIFGAGKLPQIGGNIGKAIKNFKAGIKEEKVEGPSPDKIEENTSAGEEGK